MTKLLELNLDGLFTQELLSLCPARENTIEDLLKSLKSYTSESKGLRTSKSPYSGYRRQISSKEGLSESLKLASELRERFESMLVFGIGGSALGARAAFEALNHTISPAKKKKLLINDNLDPLQFEEDWSSSPPQNTCYVVISKSGGTLETIAQLSFCIERLEALQLKVEEHIVVLTDSEKGALREWADERGIRALAVPSDVGGRFSVLSTVGLLPLAFAGIHIEGLLEGAIEYFEGRVIDLNLVPKLASRLVDFEKSLFWAHVLMPYGTRLKNFSSWFVQLWGESLGKRKSSILATGQIPVAAVGATDQHSLLQFLMEGPNKMVSGFIKINRWPSISTKPCAVMRVPQNFAALSFASQKTFADILNAELMATEQALLIAHRPFYEVSLETLSEPCLGALFAFFMDLTTLTGAALGINPFDQPGVELGKKLLPQLLLKST